MNVRFVCKLILFSGKLNVNEPSRVSKTTMVKAIYNRFDLKSIMLGQPMGQFKNTI